MFDELRANKISLSRMAVVVVLSAWSLAGGFANAQTGAEFDRTAASRGSETFRVYCSSCHGREARGDGPLAIDLKVPPANLTLLSNNNDGEFPFDMIMETIQHGRDVSGHGSQDMPAWGDAFEMTSQSEAEAKTRMEQVVQFLWSRQDGQE